MRRHQPPQAAVTKQRRLGGLKKKKKEMCCLTVLEARSPRSGCSPQASLLTLVTLPLWYVLTYMTHTEYILRGEIITCFLYMGFGSSALY